MQVLRSSRVTILLLIIAAAIVFYLVNFGLAASLADEGGTASGEEEAPSLESLTERISGLENRIAELEMNQDELSAQGLAYPIFDAIAAVFLLDQVDIHALHGRLQEGEGIMPGDAGQIRRLVPLLSAVDWPQELTEEGTALIETLTQLSEALADDDLESAVALASAAQEAQHHFSGSVSDWFERTQLPEEEQEQDDQTESADDDSGAHDDDDDDDSGAHEDGHGDDDDDSGAHEDGHGDDDDDSGAHEDGHGDDDDNDAQDDDGHDQSHGG